MKTESELKVPNAQQAAHPFFQPAMPAQQESMIGYGLTKRELMAATIYAGMCANPHVSAKMTEAGLRPFEVRESLASSAIATADALLAELEKGK